MRRHLYSVSAVVIFSLVCVFFLQFINKEDKNNGFKRKVIKQQMKFLNAFELPSSLLYFASDPEIDIKLKDITKHDVIYTMNFSLTDMKITKLPFLSGAKNGIFNLGIANNNVYVSNGQSGDLIIASLTNGRLKNYKTPEIIFDQSKFISLNSMAAREIIIDKNNLGRQLVKFDLEKKIGVNKKYVFEKEFDAFFCTDGLLDYSLKKSKVFYMYFYKGEFLCLDTNLNLLYKAKTIDTVRTAKMNIVKLESEPVGEKQEFTQTQANPPRIVNKNCNIYKDHIFIMSALRSDNEKRSDFKDNQVIDVYSVDNGSYLYSFYIPKYKRLKLREFRIKGEKLIAIYDNYIVAFNIYK